MTTMQMADIIFLGEARTTEVFSAEVGEKTIALKKIKPANQGDRRLRRLLPVLASAWSHQNHDHLARIYKVDGESIQVLMERFESNLSEIEPNESNAILVIGSALAGLDYLHRQGLLHLNIKPANILQTTDGTCKLADGLCCEAGDNASRGANPNYRFFAPEQFTGDADVEESTDLYSLGMTVLDWLAGQSLDQSITRLMNTTGGGHSVLWADWAGRYDIANPLAGELRPDLSKPLVEFLDRLLQKNPTLRFQTTYEAFDTFKRTLQSAPSNEGAFTANTSTASPSAKSAKEKDWAKGIELSILTGTQTGASHYSTTNFKVGTDDEMDVCLNPEDYSDIGGQTFTFARDGGRWQFEMAPPKTFLLNGEIVSQSAEVNDGDLLRLGPEGPDLLVRRSHADPIEILSICRNVIETDKIRSSLNPPASPYISKRSASPSITPSGDSEKIDLFSSHSHGQAAPKIDSNPDHQPNERSMLGNPIAMGLAIVVIVILALIYFIF